MNGTIKTATSKGFGFIETDMKIDFFFHHTALVGNDWKGLLKRIVNKDTINVTFDNDPTGPQGPRAINVCIVNDDSILPVG